MSLPGEQLELLVTHHGESVYQRASLDACEFQVRTGGFHEVLALSEDLMEHGLPEGHHSFRREQGKLLSEHLAKRRLHQRRKVPGFGQLVEEGDPDGFGGDVQASEKAEKHLRHGRLEESA